MEDGFDPAALERAIATRREWTVPAWVAAVAADPARGAVRGLVWGLYDVAGLRACFRVDDDGSLVDAADDPVAVHDVPGAVRLVHPAELDDAARARWGDALAEHELIAPIAQLGRPLVEPPPAPSCTLAAPSVELSAARLDAGLRGRGWWRGEPDRELRVGFYVRRFDHAGVFAVARVAPGLHASDEPQRVASIFFTDRAPGGLSVDTIARRPLSGVCRVAMSEAVYDVARLSD